MTGHESGDAEQLQQRIRELESALARSEAERRCLDLAFACAPIPMAIGDPAASSVRANRALQQRMGAEGTTTVHEIIAATHPEDIEEDKRLFAELISGKRDHYQMDKRFVRPDGSIDWAHLAIAICREADQPFTVATLQDINQLKRAEERLRTVTENLPVACVISDQNDGTIRYLNPAAARMFEVDREAAIGTPAIPFYNDPTDRDAILRLLREQGSVEDFEAWFVSGSGRRTRLSISLSPVRYNGRPCLMGVATDVTERHTAQEHLEQALAHRELLIREIHHRVKNNLQVISSLLYLQSAQISDPEIRQSFAANRQRIATMATIHDALSDSESATLPIDQLVRNTCRDLRTAWHTGTPIELGFELESFELPRDRLLPCLLVVNELVSNAIKHAFPSEGGTIRISLDRREDGEARISIEDDGIGIQTELPGDALGMALVKALVDQLQGKLAVRSSDSGTRCEVTFPLDSN